MDKTTTFLPNWASNPGNTITDILIERNISLDTFAQQMNSSVKQIENLVTGNIPISGEIANRLEINLGASAAFWINRDNQYRDNLERIRKQQEDWLKELPIKDLIKLGWIKKSKDYFKECLDFFNVKSINEWETKYGDVFNQLAFRKTNSFNSEIGSTASWLRMGEIVTNDLVCKPWNLDLFIETLDQIKPLTKRKNPKDFIPKLIELCANCGVAVGIVKSPSGCRASGATKFINSERALLLLSFRYLSDDQFWFTFFHEAGHLILHGKKTLHLESVDKKKQTSDEEAEANTFAAEILLPYTLHNKLREIGGNKRKIINLAMEAGVSPGIVVGQMQYLGLIDYKYLNAYKRRYDWGEINTSICND